MKRLSLILMLNLLAASLAWPLDVEIVTDEEQRTVWIISDLSDVFYTREFPEFLFALSRESFEDSIQAISEYEILEEDYAALDSSYEDCFEKLVSANRKLRLANKNIDSLQRQVKTQRWIVRGAAGFGILCLAGGALGWILYGVEKGGR